jgi:energy-coupling factor transport system ATP-binding protein
MDAITLQNVSFAYPAAQPTMARRVLDTVSFTVPLGSRTLLCGPTGSGKSTLLRLIKPELRPVGELVGQMLLADRLLDELDTVASAQAFGFVMQDPHQQIVMDNVRSELAFGLENLALDSDAIHRRIGEIANFFGITAWLDAQTSSLSGGQKQVVNLAAVIAMQPKILLLDEPTSQLDPIASKEFMALLSRANEELGITIIIIEHQLEEVLFDCNQVLFLDGGQLKFDGPPRDFAKYLAACAHDFLAALPCATRIALEYEKDCAPGLLPPPLPLLPLDIKEGRWWLYQRPDVLEALTKASAEPQVEPLADRAQTVLSARRLWFRYARDGAYVLRELSVDVFAGEILGIVGGNGSGKSTLLNLLAGINTPQHGKIKRADQLKLASLPQDPTALFLRDTLTEELLDYAPRFSFGQAEVDALLARFDLERYRGVHPFDLSGGEQQKAALAKLLLTGAQCLLLDEPTKGIDYFAKQDLAQILKDLRAEGRAIVIVSHDLEFVAQCADRCVMVFDGNLIGESTTERFFADNMFYTTALQRLTRGLKTP